MREWARGERRWVWARRVSVGVCVVSLVLLGMGFVSPGSASAGKLGVSLDRGVVGIVHGSQRIGAAFPGWQIGSARVVLGPRVRWRPTTATAGIVITGGGPAVTMRLLGMYVPLWNIALPAAVVVVFAFRRLARFHLPNHCPRCRYNLAGATGGRCPECGHGEAPMDMVETAAL